MMFRFSLLKHALKGFHKYTTGLKLWACSSMRKYVNATRTSGYTTRMYFSVMASIKLIFGLMHNGGKMLKQQRVHKPDRVYDM